MAWPDVIRSCSSPNLRCAAFAEGDLTVPPTGPVLDGGRPGGRGEPLEADSRRCVFVFAYRCGAPEMPL